MSSTRRNLSLLFVINILAAVYLNMIGTFLPLFIRNLKASVFEVSLVIFTGNALTVIAMMLGGFLSDKYGRKRILMLSGVFWIISPLLYISTKSWPETIIYTLMNNIAFSLFVPARIAMIADLVVRKSSFGTTYGLTNMAWPIGGLLGPLIGGMIADRYGWNAFFFFLSSLAIAYMLIGIFITESAKKPQRIEEKKPKTLSREIALTLLFFVLMHIFANTSRGILLTIFPFYLTENFGKTKTDVGIFFSVGFGLATLITQIPSGFLADKLGRKRVMIYSNLPLPFLSVLFLVTNDYLLTLLLYMAITGLWSATWPASTAYITDISPSAKKGLMIGIRLTAVRLGFTVGPLVGGFLWDNFAPPIIFYVVTLFLALSLLLSLLLKEEMSQVNVKPESLLADEG